LAPATAGFGRDPVSGLKPPPPPTRVGVKAGFEVTGGGGPRNPGAVAGEYFEPEESATFCIMPSGVRSRSDRAVI
jgi:hypothetical protein